MMYVRSGDVLLVACAHAETKRWWRNLATAQAVEVRLAGRVLRGIAVVVSDQSEAEQGLATYVRRFPRSARALAVRPTTDSKGIAANSTVLVRIDLRGAVASPGGSSSGSRSLLAFYVLALAISWGWMIPFLVAGSVVDRGSGWPTHVPALLGPMIAAILVTGWTLGRGGLRDLGSRMVRWRVDARWWLWGLGSPLAFFGARGGDRASG